MTKGAFQNVKGLHNLELVNIAEVIIEGRIFTSDGPPRKIHIKNCTIPDIPSFAFSGNVNSVIIENCSVGVTRAFAFSSIHEADRVIFDGTTVANVEAQTFKKFPVNTFIFANSHFDEIPSRFVADVAVDILFKIESTYIETVRTSGFKIHNPKKFLLINSMINKLHDEAFKVITKGEVVMDSNVLNTIDNEAFRGVSVDKYVILQNGKQKFKFLNQTVTNLEGKSLYVNRTVFDVNIGRLMIDEPCTCDALVLWTEIVTFGRKSIDLSVDSELEPIWCHLDDSRDGNVEYVSGREFYKDHCTKLTSSIYFFVIIITTTAVVLVLTIAIIVCCLKRKKKWKPVPSSSRANAAQNKDHRQMKVTAKKKGKKKRGGEGGKSSEPTKAIIVPDGRTYKETEFHIIVEKAEPLDEECVSYTVVRDRSRTQIN